MEQKEVVSWNHLPYHPIKITYEKNLNIISLNNIF